MIATTLTSLGLSVQEWCKCFACVTSCKTSQSKSLKMKKQRIKEIKGLAQGHTGGKWQSQDLSSSSSSPESKFSTRCALSCMSVCWGRCICRSQWALTECSNIHESLLSESKTNFTKLQWQRKVERFSPIDEFDEGSPTRFLCGQKETHYSFLSPPCV